MANSDGKSPSRLVVIGGGILGAVIVISAAVAIFGRAEPDALVIIKADQNPVKTAPEDPGGLKLNSIDSPVLSLLDKKEESDEGAEVLRPPVTEPELPPIEVTEKPKEPEEAVEEAEKPQEENVEAKAEETKTAEAETPKEDVAEEVAETPKEDTPKEETAENADKADEQADQQGDEIDDAIASLPVKRPTPKIVSTTDIKSPTFVVQFAAFQSEARAKNTAAVLSTKHESRLSGVTIGYMRRGEYWRVVTEPMPRADATALCSMFRSVGQDCITKLMEQP